MENKRPYHFPQKPPPKPKLSRNSHDLVEVPVDKARPLVEIPVNFGSNSTAFEGDVQEIISSKGGIGKSGIKNPFDFSADLEETAPLVLSELGRKVLSLNTAESITSSSSTFKRMNLSGTTLGATSVNGNGGGSGGDGVHGNSSNGGELFVNNVEPRTPASVGFNSNTGGTHHFGTKERNRTPHVLARLSELKRIGPARRVTREEGVMILENLKETDPVEDQQEQDGEEQNEEVEELGKKSGEKQEISMEEAPFEEFVDENKGDDKMEIDPKSELGMSKSAMSEPCNPDIAPKPAPMVVEENEGGQVIRKDTISPLQPSNASENKTNAKNTQYVDEIQSKLINKEKVTERPQKTSYKLPEILINGKSYFKLDRIGKGGFAAVYRVLCPITKQIYALKRMSYGKRKSREWNFASREISILKKLRGHQCIIQIKDMEEFTDKGYIYILMECGEINLHKFLEQQREKSFDLNLIKTLWTQMLTAVHTIHNEKIVHTDLKPANFVIVSGQLKLIDFGIADRIPNDTTNIQREELIGTIGYMAPEALQEREGQNMIKLGRPSDVWSLGCILYQMIYGESPFNSNGSAFAKIHAICDPKHEVSYPLQIQILNETIGIPQSAIDAIRKCLTYNIEDRWGIPELLTHPFVTGNDGKINDLSPIIRHTIKETQKYFERRSQEEEETVLSMNDVELERLALLIHRKLRLKNELRL